MTQAPAHFPAPPRPTSRTMPRLSPRLKALQEMSVPRAAMWAFPLWMLATIGGVMTVGVPFSYLSAATLSLAVIWASLRARWMLATGFYFTYAALEGLYKYTTDFSSAIYYIKPALVVIMAFLWWLGFKIDGRRPAKLPLTAPLAVLACLGAVQSFHPFGSGPALGLSTMFLWYLAPAFFYFLICNELKTAVQCRQILQFMLAIATVISLFAIFQYVMGQSWIEGHLPGYSRLARGSSNWFATDEAGNVVTTFRPASTTAYTGFAANWSFIGIMLACSYLLEVGHIGKRLLMMGILMFNSVGLMVTAVRVFVVLSIICLALLLVFTSRTRGRLFRNLFILALFAGLAWSVFQVGEVLSGGLLQRRYAATLADPLGKLRNDRGLNFTFLPMFVPRYPLGIGFQRANGFRDRAAKAGAFVAKDSMYFNRETQFNSIAADLGVFGLALFAVLIFLILNRAFQTQRQLQLPAAQQLAALVFVILCGYIVACLAGPSIQGSETFYLLAALATIMPALPGVGWQESKTALQKAP